jgi:hypothetical protein
MFDRFFSGALVFGLAACSTVAFFVTTFVPTAEVEMPRAVQLERVVAKASVDARHVTEGPAQQPRAE